MAFLRRLTGWFLIATFLCSGAVLGVVTPETTSKTLVAVNDPQEIVFTDLEPLVSL